MPKLFFLIFRPDGPLHEALFSHLPEDVRRRCASIRRITQAKAAAMGHLLVRFALSEASGRHPGEIVIERGPTGKPYSPNLGIQWSLSHTNGAAAVCISSAPVGVDAERIGPVRQRVLRRVLSPREQAYVLSRPEGQEARFFEVWTRKEAAVKRDGRGLSINLHSVDTFSDDFGLFTTLQEGDFIVSVCGAAPLEERNILRLEEDALVRYFQGQPFSIP